MVSPRRRSSASTVLASLLLAPAILAAPAPEPIPDNTILTNQTSMNDPNTPSWQCDSDVTTDGATTQDCFEAIMDMSSNPQMGQFHHEPPKDVWSLPKVYTVRTCNVTLDIQPGALDYSSWTDVNIRTTQLINTCAKGGDYLSATTSGTRKAGNYGRVHIYINKSGSGTPIPDEAKTG